MTLPRRLIRLASLLMLGGCSAAAWRTGAAAASAAFLPPNSTVVLISGIPGDLESETQFRQELQSWMKILGAAHAKRVVILAHGLGGPATNGLAGSEVSPATREAFLDLAPRLKQATNNLLVIVWGHGGMQGSTPVFHVRGPRITPEDFTKLAEQLAPKESRWILLFKGSGAFASQLAGENRTVVASEGETNFSVDPIGMRTLLELVRENPAAEFAEICRQLEKRTAEWYAERNLAQTEEPTLWTSNGPHELASAASARRNRPPQTSDALAGHTNAPFAMAHLPPPSTNSPSVAEERSTDPNLGPARAVWAQIRAVDPLKHAGHHGVVLSRRISYTLGSTPAISSETEEFIQVLTPEGKHLGDFDVAYSPPFEEVLFLDCEVLRPDGELIRLDMRSVREAQERTVGQFEVGRRKVFSLPGVVSGAVLHVRYRSQWRDFPLPHAFLEVSLQSQIPVLNTTIRVTVPHDQPFHYAFHELLAPDPQVSHSDYGTTHTWTLRNVSARSRAVLSPPDGDARLVVSTFRDWAAFAEWYGRIIRLTDEITPEIKLKAEELTRDAQGEREKVLAVYDYVARMRYVAVPIGISSLRPHPASSTLQTQYGDCKDKANLFNTLLRSVGIDAQLVLVPRFRSAHQDVPGMPFNHAISRVMLSGEPVWVDTTEDICRFGLLPPGDSGRLALVLGDKDTELVKLPSPVPDDHELNLQGELDCTDPSRPIPFAFRALAKGFPDYELREGTRKAGGAGTALPLLQTVCRPAVGALSLQTETNTSVSALDQDFISQGEGTAIGVVNRFADGWLAQAPLWLPREWDLALHKRSEPLFLNQGYPLILRQKWVLKAPQGSRVSLPPGGQSTTDPLHWKMVWEEKAPGLLSVSFEATLTEVQLEASEVVRFQEQLKDLLQAAGIPAGIQTGE